MSEASPREYWIHNKWHQGCYGEQEHCVYQVWVSDSIHVIEYSAYDAIKVNLAEAETKSAIKSQLLDEMISADDKFEAECIALRAKLRDCEAEQILQLQTIQMMGKDYADLHAKAQKLVEALKHYAKLPDNVKLPTVGTHMSSVNCIARDALEEWEGK